jgi:hypothetical protein
MALPTLTLTDPQNLNADMSLPMSPTIKSPDTFTSFEFERASGRPGTASSVGDGAGKYVIIMIINPPSRCREKAKERSLKLPILAYLPNLFLMACPRGKRATSLQAMQGLAHAHAPESRLS